MKQCKKCHEYEHQWKYRSNSHYEEIYANCGGHIP